MLVQRKRREGEKKCRSAFDGCPRTGRTIWKVRKGFDNIEDATKRMGFQTFWIERGLRTVQEL